ncbi:hypothetical protein M5C99_22025 [Acidovorax sp. NCPPB 2350]|nr:hypothetical protein M5C99_22025 [Acidovorax sp. NCPPB 2350]
MIRQFQQAGWNDSIISDLRRHDLKGLEYSEVGMDRYESMNSMCRWVRGMAPHMECFIIYGNDTWQPSTRISNYKKFWGLFNPKDKPKNELDWMQRSEDGVKFYGVAPIRENEWLLRSSVLERENTWMILGNIGAQTIGEHFSSGWNCRPENSIPIEVLVFARENGTFLLRFFGPAEDLKQGVIIIGTDSFIDALGDYLVANQRT